MTGRGPWRARAGRTRFWLRLIGLGCAVWIGGLVWFAAAMPRQAPPGPNTDAVVVLTGGTGRLAVGLDLLAKGKAKKLFVSGVYRGVDVRQILRLAEKQGPELECCMVLGHAADNTRGNAEETAAWIRVEGFTSLRLVTATYHMRRSLLEFHRLMPGIDIVAHPVFPRGFQADGWWRSRRSLRLVISEYVKYLIALVRVW